METTELKERREELAGLAVDLTTAPTNSWELDRRILQAQGFVLEKRGSDRKEWWYAPVTVYSLANWPPRYADDPDGYAPRFTKSHDAALSLLGPDLRIAANNIGDDQARAELWRRAPEGDNGSFRGFYPTEHAAEATNLPRAICAVWVLWLLGTAHTVSPRQQ